jgi:5-methylcytosine-specific restriction endonuclease McrA
MSRADAPPIDVAERVLRILDEGRYTATYKQAVLVALLDLCLEATNDKGAPPVSLTTRQLAQKVCALYWPHTRVWGTRGRVLVQNRSGAADTVALGGGLLAKIRVLREALEAESPGTVSLASLAAVRDERYERLIDEIEWTLVEMPLPKLQRIGERNPEWLYRLSWRDRDERDPAHEDKSVVREGDFRAYQRESSRRPENRIHGRQKKSQFNNTIDFQPGVAAAFVRLHALLRPYILRHWASHVVALNQLPDDEVMGFLFEHERTDTGPVRRPLIELQHHRCFYCGDSLRGLVHVDHFIPWARHPDNGLHNLVAADERCNGAKRDYLASVAHLQRWRARAQSRHEALHRIATDTRWEQGAERIAGVARAIYLSLPAELPLWQRGRDFEPSDPDALRSVLVA